MLQFIFVLVKILIVDNMNKDFFESEVVISIDMCNL